MTATKLSVMYGVSEKAVRDIWTGRTWAKETWHLDMTRTLSNKRTGRPKGSKDTIPRHRRAKHAKTAVRSQFAHPGKLSIPHLILTTKPGDSFKSLDEQIFDWETNDCNIAGLDISSKCLDPFGADFEHFLKHCKIISQQEQFKVPEF